MRSVRLHSSIVVALGLAICTLAHGAQPPPPQPPTPEGIERGRRILTAIRQVCDALADGPASHAQFLKRAGAVAKQFKKKRPTGAALWFVGPKPFDDGMLFTMAPSTTLRMENNVALTLSRAESAQIASLGTVTTELGTSATNLLAALGDVPVYMELEELPWANFFFALDAKTPGGRRCLVRVDDTNEQQLFPDNDLLSYSVTAVHFNDLNRFVADNRLGRYTPGTRLPFHPNPEPASEYPSSDLKWKGAALVTEACRQLASGRDADSIAGALGIDEVVEDNSTGVPVDQFDLASDPWFRHGDLAEGPYPAGGRVATLVLSTAKESRERATNLKLQTVLNELKLQRLGERDVKDDDTWFRLAMSSMRAGVVQQTFFAEEGASEEEEARARERNRLEAIRAYRSRRTAEEDRDPEWSWSVHEWLFSLKIAGGRSCSVTVRALVSEDEPLRTGRVTRFMIQY